MRGKMFSERNSECRRKFMAMCLDYIVTHFAGCIIKKHNKVSNTGNFILFDATIVYEEKELYLQFMFEKETFDLCTDFVFEKLIDETEHEFEDEYRYFFSYKNIGTEVLNNV